MIKTQVKEMYLACYGADVVTKRKQPSGRLRFSFKIERGDKAMIARRLIIRLVLLALVSNVSALAGTRARPNEPKAASDTHPAKSAATKKSEPSGVTAYAAATGKNNPIVDKVTSRPDTLKPARTIKDVRTETVEGGVRIFVQADGVAQFKDFVLADPWRVVVDLTGVQSAFGNRTSSVGGPLVNRVRVGQPGANLVRVVLDTKGRVPYKVERAGDAIVIAVGNPGNSRNDTANPAVDLKNRNASGSGKSAATPPDVKVAGRRVENSGQVSSDSPKETEATSTLLAQARGQSRPSSAPPRVSHQPNTNLPLPAQPTSPSQVRETVTQQVPAVNRSALDVQRSAVNQSSSQKSRPEMAFCDPNYVGGLVSFDLRAGVDLRDMLRFISQQYGVNFIVDKSVSQVPVDIRMTDVPWNQVMESVLRANRLGAVCESNGRMIRIATLAAIKEEEEQRRLLAEEQAKQIPLVTKIIHLKYARALGQLGSTGSGASGRGVAGGGTSVGGGVGQGSLLSIINTRLSPRGRIEMDARTNSLIITDLPEYAAVIEDMISKLDKPEPQVEIEARIVIADRNFLRDIGSELFGGAVGQTSNPLFPRAGLFTTSPSPLLVPRTPTAGTTGGTTGGGTAGGGQNVVGPNLPGTLPGNALRAAVPNSVLGLTTGALGTGILSMALTASETKGQIRTIASPRVTATDNKTAEIVNGVQIPVQTVSNNTVTTTFVTAALRLEITPQIIEETGEVLMHVVAENNTVNFALAGQFNNGTPGINTQSAQSIVRVGDGGTTVMGGINIDSEGHTINRTPGISRLPLVGELFKRRQTRRDASEILFFITPRIVRSEGTMGPHLRSAVEGMPNPAAPQQAAAAPTPSKPNKKSSKKAAGSDKVSAASGSGQ